MYVARDPELTTADLEGLVGESLDRRLLRDSPLPVALALSGGGDSLALLLAAEAWARRAGRSLLVLTVDHRLRPQSTHWTEVCAETARRLGLPFQALAWTGDKPSTGLPAAARAARHALLADAAREAGARAILMGHTADDGLEARQMRAEGSTTPEAREWSPSPAWPQGRGVFLLRPMLNLRREEIRDWLRARGETWIDDPANEDVSYARPRARQAIIAGAAPPAAATVASAAHLAQACEPDRDASFSIARAELRVAAREALTRFISAACLCAAGTTRPPARDRVERLAARLIDKPSFVATLAGARIEAGEGLARFQREAGEIARGGLAPLALEAGETAVWDGRFEVTAQRSMTVRATPGGTSPITSDDDGALVAVDATSLTQARLLAACGAIEREPA